VHRSAGAASAPERAASRRERLANYTKAIAKAVPDVSTPEAGGRTSSIATATAAEAAALTADGMDFEAAQLAYYFDILENDGKSCARSIGSTRRRRSVATVDPVLQMRAAKACSAVSMPPRSASRAPRMRHRCKAPSRPVDPTSGALRAVVGGRDYAQRRSTRLEHVAPGRQHVQAVRLSHSIRHRIRYGA
jgi:hypothetical protein